MKIITFYAAVLSNTRIPAQMAQVKSVMVTVNENRRKNRN